jgi:hypothetical protein
VTFTVRYFNSDKVNMGFIVLKQDYDLMKKKVKEATDQNRFFNSVRSLKTEPENSDKVRLVTLTPLETCYPRSHWLSLETIDPTELDRQRRSSGHAEIVTGTSRTNFWQLDLGGEGEDIPCAFTPVMAQDLLDSLKSFEEGRKTSDCYGVYSAKVKLEDYYCFVPTDMYFQLI